MRGAADAAGTGHRDAPAHSRYPSRDTIAASW